jgi:phosphoribosylaminoimidazolecarboxamide formyltransferase/IMP cyclohydrolase
VDVALMKARRSGHDLQGAALASDGFFRSPTTSSTPPRPVSRRSSSPAARCADAEVIAACDRLGLAMLFTDRREFRH